MPYSFLLTSQEEYFICSDPSPHMLKGETQCGLRSHLVCKLFISPPIWKCLWIITHFGINYLFFTSFLPPPPHWQTYLHTYIHKVSLRLARSNVLEINCKLWVLCCKSKGNKRKKVTLVTEEIESFHKETIKNGNNQASELWLSLPIILGICLTHT